MKREILTEEKLKELIDEIPMTRNVDNPRSIKDVLYIKDFCISEVVYNVIGLYIFKRLNSFILESRHGRGTEEHNYHVFYIEFMNCEFDSTIFNPIFKSTVEANFGLCFLYYRYDEHCIFDNLPLVCPSEGEFIGWKALLLQKGDEEDEENCELVAVIGKLLIPADAKRSSAFGKKCRCSKAKLLEVYALDNLSDPLSIQENEILVGFLSYDFEYKLGEEVYPDKFDENKWNECSNGIHFFMTREEAIEFAKED